MARRIQWTLVQGARDGLSDAHEPRARQPFAAVVRIALVIGMSIAAMPVPPRPANADSPSPAGIAADGACEASILAYHRFGPSADDAMTVRTSTLRAQLEYLKKHRRPVIALASLVAYLQGASPRPPQGAVVITVDDGHRSVSREMLPLVREFSVPVTLFIYPSAISNASYAMTWDELETLRRTGLFDVQSHTYWHPNFRTEKRRRSPAAYRAFTANQLTQAGRAIETRLGVRPNLIAWPFGIYDDEVAAMAREAGYVAGMALGQRCVTAHEDVMALPRFLMTDGTRQRFASMLSEADR